MKIAFTSCFLLISFLTLTQFEKVGTIPFEKRGDFYHGSNRTPIIQKVNSTLYYKSRDRYRLFAIHENENEPVLEVSLSPNDQILNLYSHADELFLTARLDNFQTTDKFRLFKYSHSGNLETLLSYGARPKEFIRHNNYFYRRQPSGNQEIITRIDLDTNSEDTLITSSTSLKLLKINDDGFFFFKAIDNQNAQLNFFRFNGTIDTLYTGNFSQTFEESILVNSYGDDYSYFNLEKNNGGYRLIKIDDTNFDTHVYRTGEIKKLHYRGGNNYFVNNFNHSIFSAEIIGDSLHTVNNIFLSNGYIMGSGISFRVLQINKALVSVGHPDNGFELGWVNDQDSIELIQDLNPGKFSGLISRHCEANLFSAFPRVFNYKNRRYGFLSNGNDEFVYLYEIRTDTLISLSKAPAVNVNRFAVKVMNDYIYYVTESSLDQGVSTIYKWKLGTTPQVQPSARDFNSETWYTELGFTRENYSCAGYMGDNLKASKVVTDESNNTYLSFTNNQLGGYRDDYLLFDRSSSTIIPNTLSDVYVKYDDKGQFIWARGVGDPTKFIVNYDQFSIDNNGDLAAFGVINRTGIFGNDTIEVQRASRYWTKIDGETGDVIDYKVLYQTDFVDDPSFLNLEADKNNDFYLTGKYNNFEINLGDTTLVSDFNHQPFVAKYDNYGNLVWARNVLVGWQNFKGDIRSLEVNDKKQEIAIYSSQDLFSGCDDTIRWRGELIIYDYTNGNEKQRASISGYGRNQGGYISYLNDDKIMLKGFVQGGVDSEIYQHMNNLGDYCYDASAFVFIYDQKQNRMIRASKTIDNKGQLSYEVKRDKNFVYFMGTKFGENNTISIQRFDMDGNYRGEKTMRLTKRIDRTAFDVGGGHIMLIGPNFSYHEGYPIEDTWRYSDVLSVLRFPAEGWDESLNPYEPMDIQFISEDLGLNVYPNPTSGRFEINFQDIETRFDTYHIANTMGQIIMQGSVPNQNFMRFDLSEQNNGIYLITLIGGNMKRTAKLVKL